ncbi:hypothetical protein [Malaciobacter marinus]|uniref:hypothetical protein n=1 Tax=Malaciobacter marinus TaxID=505249 RepID=UPI0009C9D4E4|nr:hypothetical protein [Malaciobacter marinus]SKB85210.1 hypothetical protein SAMN06295997_1712 [Malaciobacter marinus]
MNLSNMTKEVNFTLIEYEFIAIYLLVIFEKFYTNSELIKDKEFAEFFESIASKIHFLSNEAQLYLALVVMWGLILKMVLMS